mgnify:CR=1 FL=1
MSKTTFEHGKAPAWACATYTLDEFGFIYTFTVNGDDDQVMASAIEHPMVADRVCRALSLAKLAEDWTAATKNLDAIVDARGDMFIESDEANAACVKSDAARELLLKACAE